MRASDRSLLDLIREDIQLEPAGRGEFKALCPFHAEKTPSFHVIPDKNFYYCFGCCANGGPERWLREYRRMTDDEIREARPSRKRSPPKSREYRRIHSLPPHPNPGARYEYYATATSAEPSHVIDRHDAHAGRKKRFSQYSHGQNAAGGWLVGNTWAGERPLWRIPQIVAALTIYVCEGEKCADRLMHRSDPTVQTTTWMGGTNAWRKTNWRTLADRRIVLVADGDQPGHKCMRDIAGFLRPHVGKLSVVLPPLNGEDVADVIEAGRDPMAWIDKWRIDL